MKGLRLTAMGNNNRNASGYSTTTCLDRYVVVCEGGDERYVCRLLSQFLPDLVPGDPLPRQQLPVPVQHQPVDGAAPRVGRGHDHRPVRLVLVVVGDGDEEPLKDPVGGAVAGVDIVEDDKVVAARPATGGISDTLHTGQFYYEIHSGPKEIEKKFDISNLEMPFTKVLK